MFRISLSQNLTSLKKPLKPFFFGWLRHISCDNFYPKKKKSFKGPPPQVKVTICGANGQLGSIIAFLLKQSPLVQVLRLYDMDKTYGLAMDLAHIDTSCKVQSFSGPYELCESLKDSHVIVICAGVGRTPGMTLNDLFEYNAPVVKQIANAIVEVNPNALIAILTNPINSLVPMVSKILRNAKNLDSRKVFGITTIDTMRACSIVTNDVLRGSEDPAEFLVPVIGGHSPETMVPVLSQTSPGMEIPNVAFDFLINKIRCAAYLVATLKERGSPRLSVALGAARFTNNLIRGLKNEKEVIELAYVQTNIIKGVTYFATPFELGPNGVKNTLGLLKVDEELEKPYLKEAIRHLKCDIKRGEMYIPDNQPESCGLNF